MQRIIVIGSGNSALCAGISALEKQANVILLEKAPRSQAHGNTRYAGGHMRVAYQTSEEILSQLDHKNPFENVKLRPYLPEDFQKDLLDFNLEDEPSLKSLQKIFAEKSFETISWLRKKGLKFTTAGKNPNSPKDVCIKVLQVQGGGQQLAATQLATFEHLGGEIKFDTEAKSLVTESGQIVGVKCKLPNGSTETFKGDSIILASGGFEANSELCGKYLGSKWVHAVTRGTTHNTGSGLTMAQAVRAQFCGFGYHAIPVDICMRNLHGENPANFSPEEKNKFRRVGGHLGVMLNSHGHRFVDEGKGFRGNTYAPMYSQIILDQVGEMAWQIFDAKVDHLLPYEYHSENASCIVANSIKGIIAQCEGMDTYDQYKAVEFMEQYNKHVDPNREFDPSRLDGKTTNGLPMNKTNWANTIDTPPFKGFPVTAGLTGTFVGLKIDEKCRVQDFNKEWIKGLYACGEIVGELFFGGYPGGCGLTSSAVFGRIAGLAAAEQ